MFMITKRELIQQQAANGIDLLLEWLNADVPVPAAPESRECISSLIMDMMQAIEVHRKHRPCEKRVKRQQAELAEKLRQRFLKYPVCRFPVFHSSGVTIRRANLINSSKQAGEATLAHVVLDLAELGKLTDLKRCICQRWFLGRRKDQRACSAKCRHKYYEQTEAFKAHRRKYMMDYNELKRSGKVK
jgi:hypothetical protein